MKKNKVHKYTLYTNFSIFVYFYTTNELRFD